MRNVAWLGSGQAIRQVVSILTTIVLARFLGPAEFGIFAMTIFVNELAQLLVDFGMGSALIQRKEINQRLLASCFWINLAVGGVVALVLLAAGPWIAAYFEQSIIRWLMFASGLNLIVAALAVLPQALLSRQLAFKDVALGALIGSLSGAAVAIVGALNGFGVWSLALQPLVGTTVNTIYLYRRAHWLPSWEFSASEVRGVIGFSAQLLAANAVSHVTRSLPSLILGPALGVAALGLLTMAQTVAWLPVAQFSQAIVRATLPVFAQLQDDKKRMREGLYRACGLIALLAFPMLVGIAILAADLMPVVFGAKWLPAAALVSVFCVLSMAQSVATLSGTILLATGRADILLRLSLIALPVTAASLWLTRNGTVFSAVVGLVSANLMLITLTLAIALRAVGGSWRAYFEQIQRPMVHSALMGLGIWIARVNMSELPALFRLVSLSLLGAILYLGMCWLFNRRAVLDMLNLLTRRTAKVP